MSTKTEAKIQLPHFQIPKNIGEYFDNIILTYFNLAKPATPKEYYNSNKKDLRGDKPTQRGLFYLKYLGIMEVAERGKYKPTSVGNSIGQFLKAKRTEEARQSWQKLLIEHELYRQLQKYYQEAGGTGTGEGFGDYLSKHGANVVQRLVKTGGQKLCALFASKGLIKYKEEDDTFTLEESKVEALPQTPERRPVAGESAAGSATGVPMSYHIEINLTVDANTPPELAGKLFEFYWLTKKTSSPGKK